MRHFLLKLPYANAVEVDTTFARPYENYAIEDGSGKLMADVRIDAKECTHIVAAIRYRKELPNHRWTWGYDFHTIYSTDLTENGIFIN